MRTTGTLAAAVAMLTGAAWSQDAARIPPEAAPPGGFNGRVILDGPPTKLAFKSVPVEQLIPFIVEATGKVVLPQQDIMSRRITVLNDREIPRNQALDLVLLALQQNGIAVVETETTITLRDIAEITRQDVPVLGPDTSVLERQDLGTICEKVFRLRHTTAENYGEILKNSIPDYAKLTVDRESNQIAVMGNIALLQRLERLITALDRPSAGAVVAETFRLRYADAERIAQNIEDLFSGDMTGRGRTGQPRGQRQQPGQPPQPPFIRIMGPQGEAAASTGLGALRVSANTQQNSVTVVAEPAVLDQIRYQIENYWDLPLPDEAVVPKIYDLKYSDPVKVRALLEGLFGRPTTAPAAQPAGQQPAGQPPGTTATSGVGRLAGQFSFQAIPEAGRLVVVAKSPDHLSVIDKIIEGLDQPQTVGLPAIVELKHANAEDLAEQLNALLSQEGTLAQIRRSATGLTQTSATESPFAQTATQQTQQQADAVTTSPDMLTFWWQRSRPPTDRQATSNLVGQVRIVPVWRQNALMVMAPPEYRQSLVQLIEDLDKPGRQVLISAVVVEVSREDATSLGLRWSSEALGLSQPDNAIRVGATAEATENNFLGSLFDTSVLSANVDLNVVLQALAQRTSVNILSEPRVFTGDNQEAEFFSGQDIPFITQSQTNTVGNLVQSFDYKAVGIQLRVRPRITVRRDVDLRVNLELSSIVPGQTLFGGAVVDRRETTTQLIVQNGQTVVISGILRRQDTDIVRKVPLLGDIPLLGHLFRSVDREKSNTELLVFITPLVVDNDQEMERVNEPYRRRLEERRRELEEGTPPLPDRPPVQPGSASVSAAES